MSDRSLIYFIDDDPHFRQTLADILRAREFNVKAFPDGKSALESVESDLPAVALIDLKLEDMSGLELMRHIKRVYDAIECILLTGYASESSAIEAVNLGAFSYLQKPYDIDQLILSVTRAVEKQQTGRALREREARLEGIFRAAPVAIALIADQTIKRVNDQMCSILGYSKDELTDADVEMIFPSRDEYVRIGDILYKHVKIQGTGIQETIWRCKDGTDRAILMSSSVIGPDLSAGVIITGLDITERLRAQAELKRIREDWESIFQAIGHPTVILDADRTIIAANEAAISATHGDPDALFGSHCFEIFHESSTPPRNCPYERMKSSGKLETVTMEMEVLDGYFLVSCTPVFDADGELEKVIHIATDITDQKRAEEALRESEQKYSSVIKNTKDGIMIHTGGVVRYLNPAAVDMTGYELDEVAGKSMMEYIAPDDRDTVWNNFQARASGRFAPNIYELNVIRKDGSRLPAEVNVSTIEYDGKASFLVFIRDITERRKAREALEEERASLAERVAERTSELRAANRELERASRLKDEFLANMSHELRTPLNTVLGMTEALQEQVYGQLNEKQIESLQRIEQSGRHLLSLITDILDVSKIESGRVELDFDCVSVEELCATSLVMVRQQAHEKNLSVGSGMAGDIDIFRCDERRAKQILVNLLSNAVKFTPDGGTIGLDVRGNSSDGVIEFTVWDTGIGISEESLRTLFKPFVQVDSALAREYEGTGLGLTLVHRLTALHGGCIRVTSDENEGSRFTVRFPIECIEQTGGSGRPDKSSGYILIHDIFDREDLMLSRRLEDNGFDVSEICDIEALVVRAGEIPPDALICTVQGMDGRGVSAISRIHGEAVFDGIPLFVVTSLSLPGDRSAYEDMGVAGWFENPLMVDEFSRALVSLK